MLTHILITTYLLAVVWLFAIELPQALAASGGYRPVPPGWHAPRWWLPQAMCLHDGYRGARYDRLGNRVAGTGRRVGPGEGAWNAATGNGYEGGLQFLRSTWERAGGRTVGGRWASVATPREQLYRAFVIWKSHGGSWSEWGAMRVACGLS